RFAQAERELRGMRKLGRAAKPAVDAIELLPERSKLAGWRLRRKFRRDVRRLRRFERARKALALLENCRALLVVSGRDARQDLEESRHAVARRFREVGAGEIR